MKRIVCLVVFVSFLSLGCEESGSVFLDHDAVPFNDGAGLSDPMDGKHYYFGNLHSHTAYSDGEGTPAEAFQWARDKVGFDFYGVTDHAEMLRGEEWSDMGIQADRFNEDGRFVALRGFEWSHPLIGHICVYNTATFTSALRTPTLKGLYDWLTDQGAYAQFNHPGREENMFRGLAYDVEATFYITAIETGNKDTGNVAGEFIPHFMTGLANGWRLAPTSNQDNHSLTTNTHRTVIMADSLTRRDLLNALDARRVYSTDDPDMKVLFKIGAHFMGEVVQVRTGDYTAFVRIEDNEPVDTIELYDQSGQCLSSITPSSPVVEWNPVLSVTGNNYFYLVITENDTRNHEPYEETQVAVTAPIWLRVE